jgi:osmotically-inducible protein OsmY
MVRRRGGCFDAAVDGVDRSCCRRHGALHACRLCHHVQSEDTGGSIDDATITAKVQSSFLADPLVSTSAINVETRRGVVHLTGTVKSEQERYRAIQLVQGVAGVREIIVRDLVVQR